MDADFLFNIKHQLGKNGKLCSVEATDTYNGIPLGTPGVVIPDSLSLNNSSRTFFAFPPNVGINAGSALNLGVVYKEDKPVLFDDYKIKEVEAFGFGKLNSIYDSVLERGGLSIVINNCKQVHTFTESLPVIAKMFNYNSVIQSSNYNPPEAFYNGYEEEVNMVATFLRLDHCIPIFNTKKVEGMGLICTLFPKNYSIQHGMVYKIREFSMLLSSFKDNVFVIDGEHTMPMSPLSKDMDVISSFIRYSNWEKDGEEFDPEIMKPKAAKPKAVKPKAKKKKINYEQGSKEVAMVNEHTVYSDGTESYDNKKIVRNGKWELKEKPVGLMDDAPDEPKSFHDFPDSSSQVQWSTSAATADTSYYVSGSGSNTTSNNW